MVSDSRDTTDGDVNYRRWNGYEVGTLWENPYKLLKGNLSQNLEIDECGHWSDFYRCGCDVVAKEIGTLARCILSNFLQHDDM
uniref:Uncharacterized protein n=1 Tax=Physcomitrium patens TaxID=3218 RepID=A0A2K1L219_PHYPA|nr:hypothetical protein PHYPA_002861 [Physcomitrium patens]